MGVRPEVTQPPRWRYWERGSPAWSELSAHRTFLSSPILDSSRNVTACSTGPSPQPHLSARDSSATCFKEKSHPRHGVLQRSHFPKNVSTHTVLAKLGSSFSGTRLSFFFFLTVTKAPKRVCHLVPFCYKMDTLESLDLGALPGMAFELLGGEAPAPENINQESRSRRPNSPRCSKGDPQYKGKLHCSWPNTSPCSLASLLAPSSTGDVSWRAERHLIPLPVLLCRPGFLTRLRLQQKTLWLRWYPCF